MLSMYMHLGGNKNFGPYRPCACASDVKMQISPLLFPTPVVSWSIALMFYPDMYIYGTETLSVTLSFPLATAVLIYHDGIPDFGDFTFHSYTPFDTPVLPRLPGRCSARGRK